jgi:transporter family-2 protein
VTAAFLITLAAMVAGGVALATQAPINAALERAAGGPLFASAISFAVGLAALVAVLAARGAAPSLAGLAAAPWWAWSGGLLGAYYVTTVVLSTPTLGALTVVASAVLGQLLGALVLDAAGAFGLATQPITLQRLAAVALVLAGLLLSRW